jgi:hypothetical protein
MSLENQCLAGNIARVECLPSMPKALGSIPHTAKKKKKRKEKREKENENQCLKYFYKLT